MSIIGGSVRFYADQLPLEPWVCTKCGAPLPQAVEGQYCVIRYFAGDTGMVCRDCAKPFEYRIEFAEGVFSPPASSVSTASDE